MKRAYGSEPVLLSSSPITPDDLPRGKMPLRRRKGTIAVAAALAVVIMLSILLMSQRDAAVSIPAAIRGTVNYPLYEPEWLPEGYAVDAGSFDATSEVVTFTISKASAKRLVITEQPKPPQASLDRFYSEQLAGTQAIRAAVGTVTTGQFEGSLLAGIATERTWILVRSVAAMDQSQFDKIVTDFQQAK